MLQESGSQNFIFDFVNVTSSPFEYFITIYLKKLDIDCYLKYIQSFSGPIS